ncbi:exodeoxyribonuclease VII small subunit [Georgenia sp. Z1491]|uniref:exodeoxyribonuclease VII small subunit n=1 Tax=Georgenia sp. Z1491 TaxID=3416707 RepID=UPI003CF949BF
MNVRMQHPDSLDPQRQARPPAEAGPTADDSAPTAPATGDGAADDGVDQLTYEQARDELVGVVRRLESGELPLEEALRLWQRGEALADRCQDWLDGARRALDEARGDRGDEADDAGTTPADGRA